MHYLKIFSWFLFTFGIVASGAILLGIDPGIGTGSGPLAAMALQVIVAGLILWGFKLCNAGKLSRKLLLWGGWGLLVIYIVVGQALIIASES
jgi:hypothetical protein